MQINPSSGYSGLTPTATGAAQAGGSGLRSGGKVDAPPGGEDSTFTPSPDLARLLAAVRELPEVRNDVVADVSARLATGDLFTQTAANETAQAVIAEQIPNG